jgi:AraC-like DNA-binding protein
LVILSAPTQATLAQDMRRVIHALLPRGRCSAEEVAQHLDKRSQSLTEVAEVLGFSRLSAFSRWFSQHFGCGPKAWCSGARGESMPTPLPMRQE